MVTILAGCFPNCTPAPGTHPAFTNNMGGGSMLGLAFVGLFILFLMRKKG